MWHSVRAIILFSAPFLIKNYYNAVGSVGETNVMPSFSTVCQTLTFLLLWQLCSLCLSQSQSPFKLLKTPYHLFLNDDQKTWQNTEVLSKHLKNDERYLLQLLFKCIFMYSSLLSIVGILRRYDISMFQHSIFMHNLIKSALKILNVSGLWSENFKMEGRFVLNEGLME